MGNNGNNNQAYPVLTSATSDSSSTTIEGTLASAADTTFTVEFFADAFCNPSGYGEGARFLGSTTVTTDGDGNARFTFTVAIPVDPGQFIAATATDPAGNTSQFSACVEVAGAEGFVISVTTTPGVVAGTTAWYSRDSGLVDLVSASGAGASRWNSGPGASISQRTGVCHPGSDLNPSARMDAEPTPSESDGFFVEFGMDLEEAVAPLPGALQSLFS